MEDFIKILGFFDLVFIPIILIIVYVLAKRLRQTQKHLIQLSRAMIVLNSGSVHSFVGVENISDKSVLPPVNFSEGGMVSFADGVDAAEPVKMQKGFGVLFQNSTLIYSDFKDALLCSYLIALEEKCTLVGLIDFEIN